MLTKHARWKANILSRTPKRRQIAKNFRERENLSASKVSLLSESFDAAEYAHKSHVTERRSVISNCVNCRQKRPNDASSGLFSGLEGLNIKVTNYARNGYSKVL